MQSLVVPRYKELTVSKICEKIKDIPEDTYYFIDLDGDKLPERDYLISIISTINPEATKSVVKEAREHRSVNDCDDTQNLVAITSELKESIRKIAPQKSKQTRLIRSNYWSNKRNFKPSSKMQSCSETPKKKSTRILNKSQHFKAWKTWRWRRWKRSWRFSFISLKTNRYGGRGQERKFVVKVLFHEEFY